MKFYIYISLLIFSFVFSAAAQEKTNIAPKTDETLLRVETADGKYYELRSADFAKLPRREVKSKTHEGAETNFSGVDLREALKLAGVKFGDEGKKTTLISYLIVEAADNYRVVFAMSELEPNFTDKTILLADLRDGKTLSKEEGRLRLVVPDEKKLARAVRQVVRIKVQSIK